MAETFVLTVGTFNKDEEGVFDTFGVDRKVLVPKLEELSKRYRDEDGTDATAVIMEGLREGVFTGEELVGLASVGVIKMGTIDPFEELMRAMMDMED